ncbi:MAG: hypothetical protein ACLVES_04235 [Faecalibacterium prausnitzii]
MSPKKDKAAAKADYAALQKDIMEEFAEMKAAVAAADTKEVVSRLPPPLQATR